MREEELNEEEKQLIASGVMTPPKREMDWEAFWAMPRANVSDKATLEAVLWAKRDTTMDSLSLFPAGETDRSPKGNRFRMRSGRAGLAPA